MADQTKQFGDVYGDGDYIGLPLDFDEISIAISERVAAING
jgi:hypothetical protein